MVRAAGKFLGLCIAILALVASVPSVFCFVQDEWDQGSKVSLSSHAVEAAAKGDFKEAQKELEGLVKNGRNYANSDGSPWVLRDYNDGKITREYVMKLFEGLVLSEDHETEKAVAMVKSATVMNPSSPRAFNMVGQIYVAANNFDSAIDYFQRALTIESDNIESCFALALIYQSYGNSPKSVSYYKKVIQKEPNALAAYLHLAQLYTKERLYKEAAPIYDKIIQLAPDNAKAHCGLGLSYLLVGENDKARECLQKARELFEKEQDTRNIQEVDEIMARIGKPIEM